MPGQTSETNKNLRPHRVSVRCYHGLLKHSFGLSKFPDTSDIQVLQANPSDACRGFNPK